ncbi:hypothetical protein HPB48_014701 [Haemaphysalis longicornis]|uniref:Uncharacterized protein n=1 Tax=Haemaphysalis longicornis TaxID=44386 RepID=A0A9J6GW78_HAELO|nr:hypothetical protein HPB48_014701 [Haemaphysalis longicornis]
MMLCMNRDQGYTLDLISAIRILAHSWDEVASATTQRCFSHAGFSKNVATNQEELDVHSAEAHAVFGFAAERCCTSMVTVDDYEGIRVDAVTCPADAFTDILKEVNDGSGGDSE